MLFKEWSQHQNTPLDYSHGDSWDRMLQQGIKLLELFAQHDRVEIRHPKRTCRSKSRGHYLRPVSSGSKNFLSRRRAVRRPAFQLDVETIP